MSSARRLAAHLSRLLFGVGEGIRIAIDSVRENPFRSGLTILGIAIGVSVVVIMAALITGIRGTIQEGIESAGPRNFYVTRFDISEIQLVGDGTAPSFLARPSITVEETNRVNELPAVQSAVYSFQFQEPGAGGGLTFEYEGTRAAGVLGLAESTLWPEYQTGRFTQGRNFIEVEVREARNVVVLSERLARDLFGPADPLGRRIRATGTPSGPVHLTVVGVYDPGDDIFAEQASHMAVLPYTTGIRRLKADDQWGQIIVVPRPDVDQSLAEDQVIAALRSMRGLAPGEENDFSILRSTQLLELFDRFTGVFFIVMLALSSVGLMVGGVGVVGIMLISVTERTREIGVRKAVGATRGEILWQFLVESGMLTLMGGGAGLGLGAAVAWAVAAATPIPASIPIWAVVAALAMAGLTGMVFGIIPAARAARMEPVAALRHE